MEFVKKQNEQKFTKIEKLLRKFKVAEKDKDFLFTKKHLKGTIDNDVVYIKWNIETEIDDHEMECHFVFSINAEESTGPEHLLISLQGDPKALTYAQMIRKSFTDFYHEVELPQVSTAKFIEIWLTNPKPF